VQETHFTKALLSGTLRQRAVGVLCALAVGVGVVLTLRWRLAPSTWPVLYATVAGGCLLVYLAIVRPAALWVAMLALVPFSLELSPLPGIGFTVPTDAACILLTPALLFQAYAHRVWLRQALATPLAKVILLYLAWMLLCCCYSSMPVRSFKFFAATCWLMGAFIGFSLLLLQHARWQRSLVFVLLPATALVTMYTFVRHAGTGFSFTTSSQGMQPFFNDHGTYATLLAAVLPVPLVFMFHSKRWVLWVCMTLLLGVGVVFSYTRGAWLGAACMVGYLAWLVLVRRNARAGWGIAVVAIAIITVTTLQQFDAFSTGRKGEARSLTEHLASVLNTKRNMSNQERLNRWDAAIQMMLARPITGFGPGTYVEQYAPYQQSRLHTPISTNQGTLGGAHSEPLSAAADMGIPGLLLICLMYSIAVVGGTRAYLREADSIRRALYLCALGALVSYIPHALLNNFTDQDKVAAPIYLAFALLIALQANRLSNTELAEGQQ